MREPTYFLLLSLTGGPLHGYAIAKRSGELSNGRVRLSAGTLYGALDRLVGTGELVIDREEIVEGRPRRYYRLTEHGTKQLHDETAALRTRLEVADRIIGPGLAVAGS